MAEEEITINYQTLFEILRREKNKEPLQKLPPSFYQDIHRYLNEKMTMASDKPEEISMTEKQVINIRRIASEIYEKREQKIVGLALDKSRVKNAMIDTTTMLADEKEFYTKLLALFDSFREDNKYIIAGKEKEQPKEPEPQSQGPQPSETQPAEPQPAEKPITNNTAKTVRIISPIPQFVGTDMEKYGPFDKEDIAKLPSKIADVLIVKSRAEEINNS